MPPCLEHASTAWHRITRPVNGVLPQEIKAFQENLAKLHTTYPWLTVNFVSGKDDAAFAKAIAAGTASLVPAAVAPAEAEAEVLYDFSPRAMTDDTLRGFA